MLQTEEDEIHTTDPFHSNALRQLSENPLHPASLGLELFPPNPKCCILAEQQAYFLAGISEGKKKKKKKKE